MKAIVAVDQHWGIGFQGNLLQPIPEDLKFFKQMTVGNIIIMGRTTFESLPGKKPLKDRINIVLTRNMNFSNEEATVCHSLKELFRVLAQYPKKNVFVIGGESVYSQLLPYCSEAYVTKIENTYAADKYFVNLDELEAWEMVSSSDLKTYKDIPFLFTKYINKNSQTG